MAAQSFSSPPRLRVTRARRKRTGALASNTISNAAGVAGHAGPQASGRNSVPGEVGVTLDQAPEPAGYQPYGVPVNAWARAAATYPGFT